MTQLLVTGADGFIGRHLTEYLAGRGLTVRAAVRRETRDPIPRGAEFRAVGDLEQGPHWDAHLEGVDCVVHLAGRAHVMHESEAMALKVARNANVAPSVALFKACQARGVSRFVFVSSVHVLGTASGSKPFTEADLPNPAEPYAQSKWEAEQALSAARASGLTELVVVRPALVCGPGAKGNLERLLRLVRTKMPLPFGLLGGARNFVGITNLCDLLERCALDPKAAGQTYLAADPETMTLPELIRALARGLHIKPTLLPVPAALLFASAALIGRGRDVKRLTDSLLIDATRARSELGWQNARPLGEELAAMARAAAVSVP